LSYTRARPIHYHAGQAASTAMRRFGRFPTPSRPLAWFHRRAGP